MNPENPDEMESTVSLVGKSSETRKYKYMGTCKFSPLNMCICKMHLNPRKDAFVHKVAIADGEEEDNEQPLAFGELADGPIDKLMADLSSLAIRKKMAINTKAKLTLPPMENQTATKQETPAAAAGTATEDGMELARRHFKEKQKKLLEKLENYRKHNPNFWSFLNEAEEQKQSAGEELQDKSIQQFEIVDQPGQKSGSQPKAS